LANDYIAAARLDAQLEVLRQSIASYQAAVEVARLRASGQIASGLDLARASSQLNAAAGPTDRDSTAARSDATCRGRAGRCDAEHLLDRTISEFRLTPPRLPTGGACGAAANADPTSPAPTSDGGCERLDRRVARCVLSNVTFSLTEGFADSGFNLLSLPNSLWSVGAGAMQRCSMAACDGRSYDTRGRNMRRRAIAIGRQCWLPSRKWKTD